MRSTSPSPLARVLVLLSILAAFGLCFVTTVLVSRIDGGTFTWDLATDLSTVLIMAMTVLIMAPVCLRASHNLTGWLVMAGALTEGLRSTAYTYATYSYNTLDGSLPFSPQAAWMGDRLAMLPYAFLILSMFLFPDGKFLSPRWRWVGVVTILWTVATVIWPPLLQEKWYWSVALVMLLISLVAVSLILRWRRGNQILRQQLKYLIFAVLFFLIVQAAVFWIEGATSLQDSFPWRIVALNLAFATIPLAIALAIMRFRLFDIDLVIRRTTSYAVLTGILGLAYFSSVLIFQRLFRPITGDSPLALVVSTLIIAALFLPLRRRIQEVIDRRFFRRRYNAERVLEQFAATVRDEPDLDTLTAELVRVIQETMQPNFVSIWLQPADEIAFADPTVEDEQPG